MAWFKRKNSSKYRDIIFADTASMNEHMRRTSEAGLTFKCIEDKGEFTYYTYEGTDPEKAKQFLRKEPVQDEFTYIVVNTSDGVWGTDSNSLYLEKLRPWQFDTSGADCVGSIASIIDGLHNLGMAARGIVDNFLVAVNCGACEHEWIDGIRYDSVTLVRCPSCQAGNTVDSAGLASNIRFR